MESLNRWLLERQINFEFLLDPLQAGRFLQALGVTLSLAGMSLLLAALIGVAGAALKESPWSWARRTVSGYVGLIRNTPLLAQLYFFYFGVGSLFPLVEQPDGTSARFMGNFAWCVVALGLHSGAFLVETLRASIETVPRSTLDAAAALGLDRRSTFFHVVLPLALRNALPALGNTAAQSIKATSVGYALAVPELLYACNRIWTDNANVPEVMLALLATYLVLIGLVGRGMGVLERKLSIPGYHAR